MKKKYNIVIGGGIVGLLAYKILKQFDKNTYLFEQSSNLGGLLSSLKIRDNYYDHGPHFLRETGLKELDDIIFRNIKNKWRSFKTLPQSNYFSGKWNKKSSFIDVRSFDKTFPNHLLDYHNQLKKKKFRINDKEIKNLENLFSKKITKLIFIPLLKKYVGNYICLLKNKSRFKFALNRLIISSPKKTKTLKKDKFLDNIISFNYFYEGVTGKKNFYPKYKGIGSFVNYFIDNKKDNINLFLNTSINNIKLKKDKIESVLTTDNKTIYVKNLIWTGSSEILKNILKNNKVNRSKGKTLPKYFWYFFHLESNQKFKSNSFFAHIHDKNLKLFRVTFYDNFSNKNNKYRATAEVVFNKSLNILKLEKTIIKELRQIKLISSRSKTEVVKSYMIPFNVYNKKSYKSNYDIKNLSLYGQINNNNKSMEDLMIEMFNDLKNIYGKKNI